MRRVVDGRPLTDDEQDAWDERVAICLHDGLITHEQAEGVADDMIRRMRRMRVEVKA